ncbi:NUDIX hydrolase [bacterium]|nr:NUDIX hydrolase [bacterium]
MNGQPTIVSRSELVSNPWITVLRKDVDFAGDVQDYYSLRIPDYVAIVARLPDGRIPLVRQYRPAVEQFTLELPAGTVDPGESPEDCCRRELMEEVGLEILQLKSIGSHLTDTGRLGNRQHLFLVEASEPRPDFVEEAGVEVIFVTPGELQEMVFDHRFDHLLHVSALYLTALLPVS